MGDQKIGPASRDRFRPSPGPYGTRTPSHQLDTTPNRTVRPHQAPCLAHRNNKTEAPASAFLSQSGVLTLACLRFIIPHFLGNLLNAFGDFALLTQLGKQSLCLFRLVTQLARGFDNVVHHHSCDFALLTQRV